MKLLKTDELQKCSIKQSAAKAACFNNVSHEHTQLVKAGCLYIFHPLTDTSSLL